jgi:hypothetical protein
VLATISTGKASPHFAYTPPQTVYGAVRVLVVIADIRPETLAAVLRGFWRFTPQTRLLITEHPTLAPTMMNGNMRPVDLGELPLRPYESRLPDQKGKVIASTLLAEVGACITLNRYHDPAIAPSLAAIQALSNGATDPITSYFSIGHLFVGGLVEVGDQIVWGDDLIGVDQRVAQLAGHAPFEVASQIQALNPLHS